MPVKAKGPLRLLEGSLHDAQIGAGDRPSSEHRADAREEESVLRDLLDKVRTFSPG
jgi:hypothetical protein